MFIAQSTHRAWSQGRIYRATWGRAFARIYDAAFVLAERRGLRQIRRELVGRATGSVVELGAGTGLNVRHYGAAVTSLTLTEPDPRMAARLRRRVRSTSTDVSDAASTDIVVMEAPAERLPVEDDSVDTVVSTLVLCTVENPEQALAEVARVLRPGGTFLFAEHVRSSSPRAGRWQDRLNLPWSWYACGCQCNRDTVAAMRGAFFELRGIRTDRLRWISPLVRPLVVGAAIPTRREGAAAMRPGAEVTASFSGAHPVRTEVVSDVVPARRPVPGAGSR